MLPGTKANPHLGVTAQPPPEAQRVRSMRIYRAISTDRKKTCPGPTALLLDLIYLFIYLLNQNRLGNQTCIWNVCITNYWHRYRAMYLLLYYHCFAMSHWFVISVFPHRYLLSQVWICRACRQWGVFPFAYVLNALNSHMIIKKGAFAYVDWQQ